MRAPPCRPAQKGRRGGFAPAPSPPRGGRVGVPGGRGPLRWIRCAGVRHRRGDRREPGGIGPGTGVAGPRRRAACGSSATSSSSPERPMRRSSRSPDRTGRAPSRRSSRPWRSAAGYGRKRRKPGTAGAVAARPGLRALCAGVVQLPARDHQRTASRRGHRVERQRGPPGSVRELRRIRRGETSRVQPRYGGGREPRRSPGFTARRRSRLDHRFQHTGAPAGTVVRRGERERGPDHAAGRTGHAGRLGPHRGYAQRLERTRRIRARRGGRTGPRRHVRGGRDLRRACRIVARRSPLVAACAGSTTPRAPTSVRRWPPSTAPARKDRWS